MAEAFAVPMPDGADRHGLAEEIRLDGEGRVDTPDGPGLGASMDFDLIRAKTIPVPW